MATTDVRNPGTKPRTNSVKTAPGTNRIPLVVGLGTTGKNFVEVFRVRVPNLAGLTLVLDGEIEQEEALQSAHLIPVPDAPVDDYLATRGRVPILAADPLIGHIRFPHDSERGAGTCRTIGTLKAAGVLDQVRQKAGRALRTWLDRLKTRERLIVDVNLVAASGGGFGSGLILLVALLLRDQVRKLFPQARCCIHVHLVLGSNFEGLIADQDIRAKVRANELATLLELNIMQAPHKAAPLYGLLDCEEMSAATFDRVLPYHVGDERGRTATLMEVLSDRVLPNILAGTDAAVANRLRELDSNPKAKTSALVAPLTHPMVSICQASVVAVPQQLGGCWALREALKSLRATLSKPSPERLKTLQPTVTASLGLAAIQNEIARMGEDQLSGVLTSPDALKSDTALQAHGRLAATYGRYDSAVRPAIATKRQTMVSHYETDVIPRTVSDLVETLVDRSATVHELVSLLREARRDVAERAEQARRHVEEAAATVTTTQVAFQDDMNKLAAKPLLSARVKEGAVGQLNALVNADISAERYRTLHGIMRPLEAALSRAEEEAKLVHGEAVKTHGKLDARYKEFRDLATYQSVTMASVVKPEELDTALKRIDDGIHNAFDGPPAMDVKALIQGRHLGVVNQVESHVEALEELFEGYFDAHLADVTGTVKALNLNFSVREWIEENLRDLACCSPVRMSTAGNVEPQTVIAAAGEDLATVREVGRRNAKLAQIDIVAGTDPRLLLLHRRVDGLTIEAIPTFTDAKRAAAKFPKPGPGLTAWANLASSGHVLEAFEQKGLIPDAWLVPAPAEPTNGGGLVTRHDQSRRDGHHPEHRANGDPIDSQLIMRP